MIARDWGQGEMKSYCLLSTELQFAKTKKFWTVVIQQLHDKVNVLDATELYTRVVSVVMLCISSRQQKQSECAAVPEKRACLEKSGQAAHSWRESW